MNTITILIWITIAIIAAIAIIVVKLHYKGDELKHEEGSILPSTESISNTLNFGKSLTNNSKKNSSTNVTRSLSPTSPQHEPDHSLFRKKEAKSEDATYIVPETKNRDNVPQYEYESQNQVLVNYDNKVEKFQEPIKQSQMDIMNQNNEDKTELKDLFTIDELIKESKRKDNEREKEAQTISREEDAELIEIKESIKKRKENPVEEPLIEEVITESETIEDVLKEEETSTEIADAISEEPATEIADAIKEEVEEETPETIEIPSTSQKDIEEAITSASQESEKEEIEISEEENITDALLNADNDELDIPNEEIKEPALKTPSKVGEKKDYEFGAPIDDAKLFESDENKMDLDYRKDLDKLTNKITGSKLFKEVKDKLTAETEEIAEMDDESYSRNVREYDEFEPIINETHIDYEEIHDDYEQRLRQENTRRIMGMAKNSPEPELAQPIIAEIKEKPARDNIKVTIGNAEFVIKKGDEIIFNHQGETYSSQVYAIKGDDIHVRYRRQNITIKPEDVKKVY